MTGTQALARCGAEALPISVYTVADFYGIEVTNYVNFTKIYTVQQRQLLNISSGGFSCMADGRFICVLNPNLCQRSRRKWTAAHEIGHILSGHITCASPELTQEQERQADRFAAELLAPLTVLHFCGVSSALEIERLCGISRQAAELRFRELSQMRRRQEDLYRSGLRQTMTLTSDEIPELTAPQSVFLSRECDREIFMQFSPFIGNYISHRSVNDNYEQYLIRKSRQPMVI